MRRKRQQPTLGFGDHVLDHAGDQATQKLVRPPASVEVRMLPVDLAQDIAGEREAGEILEREQAGAQTVIDVMRIVGDIVRNGRRLGFGAGEAPELEILAGVVIGNFTRNSMLGIAGGRRSGATGQRSVVLDEPFERFPGEVKAIERGVASFQPGDDRQRLSVVVEAAPLLEAARKRPLAGVSERGVPEVVAERGCLRQIFVERQGACERARNLGDLKRVGQTGSVVVAFVIDEHLRLVAETAKRGRMDEAVAIAAEIAAGRAGSLRPEAAAGGRGVGRIRRTPPVARHAAFST